AWHASDDGRGGKTAHNAPVSETGENTSAQSTAADNHISVSSPFTETPSGNGDHSASAFKPSADHDATVDPGINLASIPKDHLPQQPADNVLHTPAPDHGADPAHPHVDGNQSTDEDTPVQSAPANNGHHWGADPEINFASNAQHSADNSRYTPPQDDDNSSAVTDGAHPAHGQADRSDSASPKFADDGGTHPGKVSHEPSALTALSNDVSGDDSAHGAHTAHGEADRSGDAAGPKFADDGGTNSGKVPHDPPGLTALANDSSGDDSAQPGKTNQGHHAS